MEDPPDDVLHSMTQRFYSPSGEGAARRSTRVFVANGPLAGESFELREGALLGIGRRPQNAICLPSEGISKHHATVGKDADGCFLRDEGSTNGSEVNGRPIQPGARTPLLHGDKIGLCDVVLLFVDPSATAEAAELADIEVDRSDAAREAEEILSGFAELKGLRPR